MEDGRARVAALKATGRGKPKVEATGADLSWPSTSCRRQCETSSEASWKRELVEQTTVDLRSAPVGRVGWF
jgi:hypothetical protein